MQGPTRARPKRSIVGNDAGLEQSSGIGVEVESITEALGEPLIELAVMSANQAKHVRKLFRTRERIHHEVASAFAEFVRGLRIASILDDA